MIKNGLYTLTATALDGVDGEVGGVLILHDGKLYGGDSYVFYTGTYDCSHGKWKGEMTSQEHTPTKRPMAERHQHIGFSGTYNDTSAKADAKALVGEKKYPIRCDVALARSGLDSIALGLSCNREQQFFNPPSIPILRTAGGFVASEHSLLEVCL